ncbi:bactofilin family protein [Pseudomarimonas salicorniae]|uniref:bactofilin family protein n=1 Tax=Pseudomarimonas salicorniae TaxID=2933270 RepID=UPI0031BACD96
MFGGEKSKPVRGGTGVETLIGAQVTIRGDVHFSGGLYVEGTIHGGVFAEADASSALLTVAEKGAIHGEVRAPMVMVNGELHGDVYATERIELGPNARIQGNVYYKVVEMAAGAMITGRMVHGELPPAKQLPKPEAVRKAREEAAA